MVTMFLELFICTALVMVAFMFLPLVPVWLISTDMDRLRQENERLHAEVVRLMDMVSLQAGEQEEVKEDEAADLPEQEKTASEEVIVPEEISEEDARAQSQLRFFFSLYGTNWLEERNHGYDEINAACRVTEKGIGQSKPIDTLLAGAVFTDLEDTDFFEQLMEQNADMRESIEDAMREYMTFNERLGSRKRYVPSHVMEKYMTTNEY